MIDGEVEVLEIDALPQRGDRFASRTGFDPAPSASGSSSASSLLCLVSVTA
jgi:hypothetical protein